jgi:hypothetical protein
MAGRCLSVDHTMVWRWTQTYAPGPQRRLRWQLDSLPGAGPVLTPRLIVAFGTQRERFASAEEVQRLSDVDPVTEKSGQTKCVQMRRACPKFLRKTFHEFADHSMARSGWAKAYYEAQRANAAVRYLAYKWIRIIYWCWKDGWSYDEEAYVRSLQSRNSPLFRVLGTPTAVGWKKGGRISKILGQFLTE